MAHPKRSKRRYPQDPPERDRRKERKPSGHDRGGRRAAATVQAMIDAVWFLVIHHMSREQISNTLAAEYGRPLGTPIPLATVDDYIARGHAAFAERNAKVREKTKELQLERLYGDLQIVRGSQDRKSTARTEDLIAKIEGNLAPRVVRVGGNGPGPGGGPIDVRVTELTSDEQRKRIVELQETARARAAAAVAAAVVATEGETPATDQPPPDADGDPQ